MVAVIRMVAGALFAALLWTTPARAEWREASSDHFVIYADAGESWLRGFADRLERFDGALRAVRGMDSPPHLKSNRLVVYVVRTPAEVQRICGRCGNVGGYYIPRAGGSIAFTARDLRGFEDSADLILFHEYTHHFMFENFAAAYPRWFGEGFAELNSTAKIERDGAIQFGGAPQGRAYALRMFQLLPIEVILDPTGKKMTALQHDQFYGQSWLLTHMLSYERSRSGQLNAYLRAINAGTPNLDAARQAFGNLDVLEKDLRGYLDRRSISGLRILGGQIKPAPIAIRRLGAGEAAMMQVRMRSDRGVDAQEAAALLPEARRRAAPYPNDAAAQTFLAEAEYDAGYDAEAEAAADRALAVDPKRRDALLYKGRARLRLADRRDDSKPADFAEARSWFVKANRLDPDAAEPLELYYASFLVAGQTPSKSAKLGLERALELSPQDRGLRMTLASMLLADDRKPEARQVLLPLAYDPHGGPDNPAAKLIAELDKGRTDTVKRALDKEAKPADAADGAQ